MLRRIFVLRNSCFKHLALSSFPVLANSFKNLEQASFNGLKLSQRNVGRRIEEVKRAASKKESKQEAGSLYATVSSPNLGFITIVLTLPVSLSCWFSLFYLSSNQYFPAITNSTRISALLFWKVQKINNLVLYPIVFRFFITQRSNEIFGALEHGSIYVQAKF